MKKSKRIVFCAMLAALSATLVIISRIIPFSTDIMPAIAGMLNIIIVVEIGAKWALASYLTAAVLCFIFGLNETSMLFLMFFGYYPIIKSLLEKLSSRSVEWLLKILIFNAAIVAAYAILIPIFGLEALGFGGKGYIIAVWVLSNIFFVLYDILMTKMIPIYFKRYHKSISKYLR